MNRGATAGGGGRFSEILEPEEAVEPILARPVRNALLEWLTEIWAEDELKSVGLEPRRRALFYGAPGTGKTTLAHHLAARLGLRLAVVRPDDIHGRYVGSNTSNLKAIFDLADATVAAGDPVILFFDEFEVVARKRMTSGVNELGEHDHNAMVNTLLVRLDHFPGFIIAASNHHATLDPAVWRRFDIQIALDAPGQQERQRILARYLAPYGLPGREMALLAEAFETASPALMRQFCEALKRQIVVGPKVDWPMDRNSAIGRILAAVEPHPDVGKPRLWSHGTADVAVRHMSWPLRKADDLAEYLSGEAESTACSDDGVIAFGPFGGR